MVTDPELTDRVMGEGRGDVRASEALGTMEPTGCFERAVDGPQTAAYRRPL